MNYIQKEMYNKPGALDLVSLTRGIKYLVDNKTYIFFYKSSMKFLFTFYEKLTFSNNPQFPKILAGTPKCSDRGVPL